MLHHCEVCGDCSFYPADDEPGRLNRNFTPKAAALRPSITPGTVLIVLAGRFRGRRVVFLKQLESGLLLVTGPFKLNGCPLRRINQAYVIATSTKVDLSGVSVPAEVNDRLFKTKGKRHEGKSEEKFFEGQESQKPVIDDKRKQLQAQVDEALLGKLDGITKSYLAAVFTLRKGDRPHEMKF